MQVNHYEVLGVDPSASPDQVKAAYTRLLRQVHPDVGGNAGLFILVQAAWDVLGNPRRRAAYDEELRRGEPSGSRQSSSSGSRQSNTGDAGNEHFRRAYDEEAGREQFRQDQARKQREEWERQQAGAAERDRATKAAAAEREKLDRAAAARVKPYYAARAKLDGEYIKYHDEWNVPLKTVLQWQATDWVVPRAGIAILIVGTIYFGWLTASATTHDPGSAVLVFIINGGFIGFGLFVIGAIIGYLGGKAVKFIRYGGNHRENVSQHALCEEYLRDINAGD